MAGIALFCWRLGGKGKLALYWQLCALLPLRNSWCLRRGRPTPSSRSGAAMLLWGLYTGRNLFRNTGLGLLLAIKPLGFFAALPMLIQRKTRAVTIIFMILFLLLLSIALSYTILENPGYSWSAMDVFKSTAPPGSAFKYSDSAPPKDYFFQFARYLVVGEMKHWGNASL